MYVEVVSMYVYDSTKKETVNMENRNLKDAEPQETFALRNTKSLRAQLESFVDTRNKHT